MIRLFFPVFGAVFLILFLRQRIVKPNAYSLIFKTLTSVCFMFFAFSSAWPLILVDAGVREGYGAGISSFLPQGAAPVAGFAASLVTAGLFCGLLGDIWLDLKWNCRSEDKPYTYAGFVSFGLGHIFFMAALFRITAALNGSVASQILPLVIAAALGTATVAGGKFLKMDFAGFRAITIIYGSLLIGSATTSGCLVLQTGFRSPALIVFFAGAACFVLSDLLLSGTYFGVGHDRPVDTILNHVLYYAAQFLIAGSLLLF